MGVKTLITAGLAALLVVGGGASGIMDISMLYHPDAFTFATAEALRAASFTARRRRSHASCAIRTNC